MKQDTINASTVYLGNLFIIHDGIGTVSDIKYAVIKTKKNLFSKAKYISYPEEKEVLVGCYELTYLDEDIPFLINSTCIGNKFGCKKITSKELCNLIIKNNNISELRKVLTK